MTGGEGDDEEEGVQTALSTGPRNRLTVGEGSKLGRIAALARAAVDLAFPPVCVDCGALVEGSGFRHLCAKCALKIEVVQDPACSTCGHPYYGEVVGERMCPHCVGLMPAFRAGRTAVLCKGPARALVHELKYYRGAYVLADIEAILRAPEAGILREFVRGASLIPVPLHPRKEQKRGYNQSFLLAECFARVAGGKTEVANVLRRVVNTKSQTAFDRRSRQTNLKNAFALARGAAITPGQHYILVDDVFTTGSTLNSCAGVLRRAGCLSLDVVTFGHG